MFWQISSLGNINSGCQVRFIFITENELVVKNVKNEMLINLNDEYLKSRQWCACQLFRKSLGLPRSISSEKEITKILEHLDWHFFSTKLLAQIMKERSYSFKNIEDGYRQSGRLLKNGIDILPYMRNLGLDSLKSSVYDFLVCASSMAEENKHIDELIANYLTEGLDKNALDELKTWIAASAENQQYFIRQREIWFSAVSREAASVYDKDKAFENFRNRVESQKEIQSTSRRGFSLSALWRYAAVVAIIIAVGCISYWQGEVNVKDTFADISVEAPLGSKTKLYLPDGTLVWLNAGSRMTYSQGFGVDNRKVELEGEGYFEVKRNEKIPFFVKTKDLQLQVLGTKFNFRDYPEDHEVVVSLLEGKVGLNNLLREEKEAVLSPDERAVLNKANGLLTVESVTASNASQWTDGYLFFDEELLPDIAKELERSYNVKIHIANDSLKTFRFYGNFVRREQNIQEVLEALASTEKMQYKIEERNITIY